MREKQNSSTAVIHKFPEAFVNGSRILINDIISLYIISLFDSRSAILSKDVVVYSFYSDDMEVALYLSSNLVISISSSCH